MQTSKESWDTSIEEQNREEKGEDVAANIRMVLYSGHRRIDDKCTINFFLHLKEWGENEVADYRVLEKSE
jgi:hypothetical protein